MFKLAEPDFRIFGWCDSGSDLTRRVRVNLRMWVAAALSVLAEALAGVCCVPCGSLYCTVLDTFEKVGVRMMRLFGGSARLEVIRENGLARCCLVRVFSGSTA